MGSLADFCSLKAQVIDHSGMQALVHTCKYFSRMIPRSGLAGQRVYKILRLYTCIAKLPSRKVVLIYTPAPSDFLLESAHLASAVRQRSILINSSGPGLCSCGLCAVFASFPCVLKA